jgi:hypothetical protein
MGEPVESVSGDLWPKTSVVMGVILSLMRVCAPYRRAGAACHLPDAALRHKIPIQIAQKTRFLRIKTVDSPRRTP